MGLGQTQPVRISVNHQTGHICKFTCFTLQLLECKHDPHDPHVVTMKIQGQGSQMTSLTIFIKCALVHVSHDMIDTHTLFLNNILHMSSEKG